MRNNNPSFIVAGLLIGCAVVALLLLPLFSGFFVPRASELERIVMPDGSILVVHAILTEPRDAYSVSDGASFLAGSRLIATQRPESGVTVVLSRRDAKTDDYLSMDWFGRIELEDNHGDKIYGWQTQITQAEGAHRRSSGSTGGGGYSEPLSKGYRLLIVPFPHVSPANPIRFDVIDRDGKKVADFGSPRPFASDVDPAFASAVHSNSVSVGDFDLDLEEVQAHAFGKLINGAKWFPQSQLTPRFTIRHRGDLLAGNHYAIYKLRISDADGNLARANHMYLSRKQPLWKLSFNIARTCYAENFTDDELSLLSEIDVANTSAPVHLSPESLKPKVTSMVYFPSGNHTTQLNDFEPDRERARSDYNFNFQGGRDWYGLRWMNMGYWNHHSSGGSNDEFDGSNRFHVGDIESETSSCKAEFSFRGPLTIDGKPNTDPRVIQFGKSRLFKGVSISSKSTCALVAVEFDEPSQRHVLNLIAKDQNDTRLAVHPMQHALPHLPTYAIETLPTTTSLRIYGCVDKLEYAELFIKPPTAGLEMLNDPTTHSDFRIVAEQDNWNVVEEHHFDSK